MSTTKVINHRSKTIVNEEASSCAPEDGVVEHEELKIFTIDKLMEPSIERSHTKAH